MLNYSDIHKKQKNEIITNAKPFLKWVGGKTQLLNEISILYPFGMKINKYIEPFVGGGAVLFNILNTYEWFLNDVFISDINADLINCYAVVRDKVDNLIKTLSKYETTFLSLNTEERTEFYNKKRKRFNEIKTRYSLKEKNDCIIYHKNNNYSRYQIEAAALLIFLNKTCYNGLYRENLNGEFNTPIGKYEKPEICDTTNLYACSEKLQGAFICACDFETALSFASKDCFVYLDPPYRPISDTSAFTSYANVPFNDEEQKRLSECVYELNDRAAQFVLSNSDPHNTDINDDFFDDLYSEFSIKRVQAGRAINSNADKRGKVSELLIYN